MSDPFYQRGNSFPSGTTARGSAVQDEFDGVETGFDQVDQQMPHRFDAPDFPGSVTFSENAAARANKVLGFDANGDPAVGNVIATTVSAFIATLVDDLTALAARRTLEAASALGATQGAVVNETSNTIYVNPHVGGVVYLFDGTTWGPYTLTFQGLSTAINTLTGNTTYYVYLFLSGGAVTHEVSTTAPTESQSVLGGIPHKTGAQTHLLVATVRTAAGSPPSTLAWIQNRWTFNREINSLPEDTAPVATDRIAIQESGGTANYTTLSNVVANYLNTVLLRQPNLLTNSAALEAADELSLYDASLAAQRAVTLTALHSQFYGFKGHMPFAFCRVVNTGGAITLNRVFGPITGATDIGVGKVGINFSSSVAAVRWVAVGVITENAGFVNHDNGDANQDANTVVMYTYNSAGSLADLVFNVIAFVNEDASS